MVTKQHMACLSQAHKKQARQNLGENVELTFALLRPSNGVELFVELRPRTRAVHHYRGPEIIGFGCTQGEYYGKSRNSARSCRHFDNTCGICDFLILCWLMRFGPERRLGRRADCFWGAGGPPQTRYGPAMPLRPIRSPSQRAFDPELTCPRCALLSRHKRAAGAQQL